MKNWLRKGILYGTALAALAGCGVDSNKAVGPESRVNTAEEASSRIRSRARNPELEQRVNNALGRMSSARKTAQSEIQHFPYGEFTGDLDLNHHVDFDDFFRLADEFGVKYGFDHFFSLADNFGGRVNSMPRLVSIESSKGDTVNVGEEIVLSGVAQDVENDSIDYKWSVKNEPVEVNGSVLRRTFNEAGEYPIALRVLDSFGAQSNELSRTLNVRSSGPVLSLPDTVSFDQYIVGPKGNIFRASLDDYVQDDRFGDGDLVWSTPVVNDNQFNHSFGNNLLYPYTAKALQVAIDGDRVLIVDPVANYNASDHGMRSVDFSVSNPNGLSASERIVVNVRRTPSFDNHYDDVVTGGGWLNSPPETAYIWIGNGRIEGDPTDPRLWTGTKPTNEDLDEFRKAIGTIPEVSDYFKSLKIVYLDENDADIIYHPDSFPKIGVSGLSGLNYLDRTTSLGGVTSIYPLDLYSYDGFTVSINAILSRGLKTKLHEVITHALGMNHPLNETSEDGDRTVFTGLNRLDYVPDMDKAVIDSFYEIVRYK